MSNLKDAATKLINNIADDAEITKEIYDDGLKPAVVETGKALREPIKGATRVGRLINALFSSIDCWILEREYAIKETQKLLDKKLENIPDEDIEPPKNYIAIPALQALSYSMDSKELRNMYANLLAKSMRKDLKDNVHPAYVEIIKQLEPNDVKIFNFIATSAETCLAVKELYIDNAKENTKMYLLPMVTSIDFLSIAEVSSSLYNLQRCCLIEKINGKSPFKSQKLYNDIDNNPLVKEWIDELSSEIKNDYEKVCTEKSGFVMTTFGVDFYNICCKDEDFD